MLVKLGSASSCWIKICNPYKQSALHLRVREVLKRTLKNFQNIWTLSSKVSKEELDSHLQRCQRARRLLASKLYLLFIMIGGKSIKSVKYTFIFAYSSCLLNQWENVQTCTILQKHCNEWDDSHWKAVRECQLIKLKTCFWGAMFCFIWIHSSQCSKSGNLGFEISGNERFKGRNHLSIFQVFGTTFKRGLARRGTKFWYPLAP